jgi:hypothetical protein
MTVDLPPSWTLAERIADAQERAAILEFDARIPKHVAEAQVERDYGLRVGATRAKRPLGA